MRLLLASLLSMSVPAAAQIAPPPPPPIQAPPLVSAVWNPAAAYITVGQDEVGYRNWVAAAPRHSAGVRGFNAYLMQWGVSGIVPTWQLLRTATSWQRCGGMPFEVPPMSEWPHIVQTLRYINDYVIPAVGPVEPVSAYRNPSLNACAGGAAESAHKHYSAIDLVPLQQTTREQLMRRLCTAHARRGTAYDVGLGFYAYLRFHVDTTKFRRWGASADATASCPAIVRPPVIAAVQPAPQLPPTQTATPPSALSTVVVDQQPPASVPPPATPQPTPPVVTPAPTPADPLAPAADPLAPTPKPAEPSAPILPTGTPQR